MTTEDGTGIVHVAPAYGEDDLKLGQRHGLPVLHAVGEDGYFLRGRTPVAGKFFKDADPTIIEILRERGLLFRAQKYLHNYPFGWRTGDPLIYYAKNAWYIRTTEYPAAHGRAQSRHQMGARAHSRGPLRQLAREQHRLGAVARAFLGHAVAGLDGRRRRNTSASAPSPSSRRSRAAKLGELDLHRPAIDGVTFVHEGREYRRVAEVIDCWFDSGAMPYAQWHYPFENAGVFAQQLSGRLHLRSHRPDARLVLHAARDRDDGLGSGRLQERRSA